MYIATLAWLCLVLGVLQRHNRRHHVALMLAGIFLDIALVLYLQFTRSAIQTALAFKLSLLEQMHIWLSTTSLLLYFPVLFLGFKLLKSVQRGEIDLRVRKLHIRFALTAFCFRTAGFMFMFSMLK